MTVDGYLLDILLHRSLFLFYFILRCFNLPYLYLIMKIFPADKIFSLQGEYIYDIDR